METSNLDSLYRMSSCGSLHLRKQSYNKLHFPSGSPIPVLAQKTQNQMLTLICELSWSIHSWEPKTRSNTPQTTTFEDYIINVIPPLLICTTASINLGNNMTSEKKADSSLCDVRFQLDVISEQANQSKDRKLIHKCKEKRGKGKTILF